METKDRLKKAYEYLRNNGKVHTQQNVADIMGVKKENVSRAFNGNERYLTLGFITRFNNAFGNIFNIDWIIKEQGDMLISGNKVTVPQISYTKGVPYYNVDFIGGFDIVLNDQTINPEYLIDFQKYNEATCWCNVSGHSMEPEINNGDIIALKKIEDFSFLPLGEIYAIVTTNGMRTIKRLGPSRNPECYTLVPTNKSPEYGTQELRKDMIQHIFQVLGCMKKL